MPSGTKDYNVLRNAKNTKMLTGSLGFPKNAIKPDMLTSQNAKNATIAVLTKIAAVTTLPE